MSKLKLTVSGLGLALLLMATASAASDRTLYRWVDEKGQVHYGDKVPAKDAKQGRETINKQGVVTKAVPRELQGEELAREQARQAAEKEAQEARQRRLTHDRYLLQSFSSVAGLQTAREERLTALDARINLAQAAVTENEKVLADLREREQGKAPSADLRAQIESFESSLIDNLQALRKLRDERASTEQQYTDDIARFKALRSGAIKKGD